MANVDELIDRLKNFRTRSAAKNALLEIGEPAIPPLIQALKSRQASARWSAASILGGLGAKQAIPDLIEGLRDPEIRSGVVEALRRITGEDFGEDYDAWKRWLDIGGGEAKAGAPATAQSDADFIAQAVYGTDVSAEEKGHGYVLRVPLGDRHQDVTANFRAKDSDGIPLLVVYTRCGPATAKHYEWALRQNVKMSAGAIAVTDIDGKPGFVIVDVLVRDSATPQLLMDSVKRIARKGDQLEAALTKADAH